jgi:hypothetical protein
LTPTAFSAKTAGMSVVPELYFCEAQGAAYSQTLNILSNAAYFLAGYALWKSGVGGDAERRARLKLSISLGLIGIGSGLWHIFMLPETLLLDASLISLYFVFAFTVMLKRFFDMGAFSAAFLASVALGTGYIVMSKFDGPRSVNEGEAFLPLLLVSLIPTVEMHKKRPKAAARLITAAVWMTSALAMRLLDLPLCDVIPFGTHFLWHLFGAVAGTYYGQAVLTKF